MQAQNADMMQAMTISEFGGVEKFHLTQISKPQIEPDEILMQVEAAGVGEWDPFEREGGFAKMTGNSPTFPYTLGSEGAGIIERVGSKVTNLKVGDRVFAASFLNSKGGFYAEYAAVKATLVAPIPAGMSIEQAATFSGVALTALRGLDDTLKLHSGETLLILGASGGVGHMAVQLAQIMGVKVIAVASGSDGIKMVESLGAENVVDGHDVDLREKLGALCPDGADAALLLVGGKIAEQMIQCVKKGGRAAYPAGAEPAPEAPEGVALTKYNGDPDQPLIRRLNELISKRPLSVYIAQTFPFTEIAAAHKALKGHHVGKFALFIH